MKTNDKNENTGWKLLLLCLLRTPFIKDIAIIFSAILNARQKKYKKKERKKQDKNKTKKRNKTKLN